jgi:hypothetical protein
MTTIQTEVFRLHQNVNRIFLINRAVTYSRKKGRAICCAVVHVTTHLTPIVGGQKLVMRKEKKMSCSFRKKKNNLKQPQS